MGDRYIVYNNKLWKPYKTFEYTGEPEEFTLPPDTYLFVADGAKGGCATSNNIAYGGTTYGILDLDHTQKMYAVVGGNGEDPHNRNGYSDQDENYTRAKGGYNGGGDGGLSCNPNSLENGAAGGGATDIRLSIDSYYMINPTTIHSIPEGYDQVAYIHGNKQQCIVVDYDLGSIDRVEVLAYSNPDSNDRKNNSPSEHLFSCDGGSNAARFMYQIKRGDVNNTNMYFVFGNDHRSMSKGWPSYDITKISLEQDRGEIHYTDEVAYAAQSASNTLTPNSTKLAILGQYNETADVIDNMAKASIFYVKVYKEDKKLMRYLVPYCKHATDASQIDVSSVEWHNKYYGDTESLRYMHTESYIPIDATCEGIRVHIKLTDIDDHIIRVDYYDENYNDLGTSGYGITYMPYGNYRGFATRKQPVMCGDLNIYPPFSEAKYIRIVIAHPTTDLDTSMIEEFSLTYLTYEGGYEAGLYDLIEGKKYPCTTPNNKFYYGGVVEKTVWQSRYENIKYAKMIIHRNRSNNSSLSLAYSGFRDIEGNLIPMSNVSAIRTDGSAVTYANESQTVSNLIVFDDSIMTITGWSDTTTDVAITFEFEEAVPSYHLINHTLKMTSNTSSQDPYEWEVLLSSDNITWHPFTRRMFGTTTTRLAVLDTGIVQPDNPINMNLYSRIFVAGGAGGSPVMWGHNNGNHYQEFIAFGGGSTSGWVSGSGNTSNNVGLSATQNSGFSFGKGRNAEDKNQQTSGQGTWSYEGQGGGGGGWYGGYSLTGKTAVTSGTSGSATGGSGGSSYVLTDSSYKPENYMLGFEDIMPSLYFRDFLMLPGQAFDGPMMCIYKEADYPAIGAHIIMPYVGGLQPIDFLPGQYRIKCYGGHGGTLTHYEECGAGGYAEGVMNLDEPVKMYGYVGNSAYLLGMDCDAAKHDTIFNNKVLFKSASYGYSTRQEGAAGGGGAVDLRLIRDDIPVMVPHTIPPAYDELEYIVGNFSLRTDYIPKANTKIEFYGLARPQPYEDAQAMFGTKRAVLSFYSCIPNLSNRTCFANNQEWAAGQTMPWNTDVKIIIDGQTASVYDANDNLLFSITSSYERVDSNMYLYIFDTGYPAGDPPDGGIDSSYSRTLVRYMKIWEGETLVRWFVPYTDGLYDLVNGKAFSMLAEWMPGIEERGPVKAEKTAYYKEDYPIEQSLLSRIIVAGGGGGATYESYNATAYEYGGAGGGLSGGNRVGNASSGTNNGPGTQTGTPAQSKAGGGFGYGGVGVRYSGNNPGCGGGGWYGGNGTYSENSNTPRGGAGGSGYVLTETSYKPSGYTPDSKFWMSDTQLVTGGNTKRGMTRIEIEVEKVTAVYILAQDAYSFKAYNPGTNEWESIAIEEANPEAFNQYGVAISLITSDAGLMDTYKLYVYDKFGLGVETVRGLVVPLKQHVLMSERSSAEILDKAFDADRDDNVDIDLDYTVTGVAENRKLNVDISFDMNDVPINESTVYVVQFKTRMKPTSYYYPTKPEKTIDELKLLKVGTGDVVPNRYKTHIGSFMPDGSTAITAVQDSVSCEYKRNIYTASLLNNSVIRITRFNIIENKSYIIRDNIPVTALDPSNTGCCGGGILVNDDNIYLSNSSMLDRGNLIRILRIPIDPSQSYVAYSTPSYDTNYYVNAYGKMEWVSPTMILLLTQYGFVRFNTLSNAFTFVPDSDTDGGRRNDFCVGKYTVISYGEFSSCYGPRVYDRSTLDRINFSTAQWQVSYEAGVKCTCYDDGKFYITQTGHLYIVSDNPEHDLTTPDQHILTPYTSYQPKTISVSNGLIYVTIAGSTSTLYIYNMKVGQWISTSLPFNTGSFSNTSWYRPACFLGFFFVGNMKLYVANFNNYTKYKVGQKSNVWLIQTNDSFPGSYTYDKRFVSIDNTGIHFNTGYIDKQLTCIDDTNGIYQSGNFIKSDEYKQIISYGFTTSGEEEEDSNEQE